MRCTNRCILLQRLLLKAQRNQPITVDEYDVLVKLIDELRFLITELRGELNQNQQITSRLMGKVFESANEG